MVSYVSLKPSAKLNFVGRIAAGMILGALIHQIFWKLGIIHENFPDEFFNSTNSIMASTTEAHHLVFGIGGGADYWEQRWKYSELWWVPNTTRGFVWLENPPPVGYTWPATAPPFKVSGTTEGFHYNHQGGSRTAIHLVRTLKETVDLNLTNVRWFVYGDDDTIFFVENLLTVLRKYDHNQMYYIGQISECDDQNSYHYRNMAFGGGGYAISYELAKEVARNLDGCIDRYASAYGSDLKLQGCITELGVSLTIEPGFHQLDVRGDIYGLLAAHPVAPFVSLHHVENLKPLIPGLTMIQSIVKLKEAYKVDPGRTLQQCFCSDKVRNVTISVSWGYTVQIYEGILRPKILEEKLLTFNTFTMKGPFTFDIRAVTEKPRDQPMVYMITEAEKGNEEAWTTYNKTISDFSFANISNFKVESIIVLADRLDERYWHKAPRRQCCEVVDDVTNNPEQLVIRIRNCRQFETTIGSIV